MRYRHIIDALVRKKYKALYENGWSVGSKEYFNTTLEEYFINL